jgi:predicted nuclease of predicted toxin-antitoxin system
VKLLLDEQISDKVAGRLRAHGHDAIAVTARSDWCGRSDAEIFEIAQAQGRAVVTYDRGDFEAIVREYAVLGREHHGLVIVPPARIPNHQFARLAAALASLLSRPDPGSSFIVWLG